MLPKKLNNIGIGMEVVRFIRKYDEVYTVIMGLLVKCVETESVVSVPVLWVGITVGEC